MVKECRCDTRGTTKAGGRHCSPRGAIGWLPQQKHSVSVAHHGTACSEKCKFAIKPWHQQQLHWTLYRIMALCSVNVFCKKPSLLSHHHHHLIMQLPRKAQRQMQPATASDCVQRCHDCNDIFPTGTPANCVYTTAKLPAPGSQHKSV